MPRSRLRAHLDEVIADADLRAGIDQVVSEPGPTPMGAGSIGPVSNGVPAPATPPVEWHAPAFAPHDAAHLETVHSARRRRRSASLLPPLPSPADLADDASGRVELITITLPPATPPAGSASASSLPPATPLAGSASASSLPLGALAAASRLPFGDALGAWLPVAALGVALLVIFVIGMVVTH